MFAPRLVQGGSPLASGRMFSRSFRLGRREEPGRLAVAQFRKATGMA
jgi:hypothetical protein